MRSQPRSRASRIWPTRAEWQLNTEVLRVRHTASADPGLAGIPRVDGRPRVPVLSLHDIGDLLGPANHAEIGAVILKPYVSEQNHWMLDKHGIFQGYYFFHHLGLDRDMREQFRGHPDFEYTAQFCHLYDQNSFDPDYVSMPLSAFEPMLRRVLATPKRSIYRRETA